MLNSLRKRRPAGLWPEMEPIGQPAYEGDEEEWIGEGSTWSLGETVEDQSRIVAVLWLPTPDKTHLQHIVYGRMPYSPEPEPRPIGYRFGKAHPDD